MEKVLETEMGVLFHGDNIEVLKAIEDESVDFILADYPFNCQDGRKDYISYITEVVSEFWRVLKWNCVLVTINNPPNVWKTRHAYDMFTHRDSIALIRPGSLRPAWHFGFQHNYLMTFVKGEDVRYKWNGTKVNHDKSFPTDVIEYQNSYRGSYGFHPQAIPFDLTKMLIELFTNEGDVVLDPFMGSGTTALVCEEMHRQWIGVEFDERYCEMSKRRIRDKVYQRSLGEYL